MAGRKIEREGYRGEQTLVSDRDRGNAILDGREKTERDQLTGCRRPDMEMPQRLGGQLIARIDFLDDVVLVQLREQRRDLALSEGVVQHVVNRLRGDPEARCGVAVDLQGRTRGRRLRVRGYVAQFG